MGVFAQKSPPSLTEVTCMYNLCFLPIKGCFLPSVYSIFDINMRGLKENLLVKAHQSKYTLHPGTTMILGKPFGGLGLKLILPNL